MSLREDMDKAISEIIKEKDVEEDEVAAFVKDHFRKIFEHWKKTKTAVGETHEGLEDGSSDPVKQKTKEKFADRFIEHDKRIMEAYTQKEKRTLKKELLRLEDDRVMTRGHLHRIEALIEKLNGTDATFLEQSPPISLKDGHDLWFHLETKLKEWENRFAKIWAKKADDHTDTEHEYAKKELPLLKAEKRSIQMRLINIEGIIAKARLLAVNLNEDLCRKFSKGRTLADTGEILLQEFDHKLQENHAKGRQTIRNFLEKHLNISKTASRDLFSLLEETGILFYRVDITEDLKDAPLVYYPYEKDLGIGADPGTLYPLTGWWEISSQRLHS
ncbi:MAG: hypothetical protein GXP53_07860 [Deltaproteobacteria bacterium]|nr:hypothetical protein [Deltaproteobacteria bacterium]